jgi:SAM-dependent methyltransferase
MKGCLQARQTWAEPIAAARLRLNVLVQQYVKNTPREEDSEAKKEEQFSGEVGEEDGLEEHPFSNRRFSTTFVSPLTIHAPIERLPLGDGSVDVAISNCVLNHCADKLRAFREVFRVLKVGGRLCISDLVISGAFSEAALKDELWGEWLGTAQAKSDFLRAIEQAGFQAVTVEGEAVFPMAERDERLKGQITSIWLTARKG